MAAALRNILGRDDIGINVLKWLMLDDCNLSGWDGPQQWLRVTYSTPSGTWSPWRMRGERGSAGSPRSKMRVGCQSGCFLEERHSSWFSIQLRSHHLIPAVAFSDVSRQMGPLLIS